MSIQVIILIIAVVLIIWLGVCVGDESAFDFFMKQKNHIFHNINKWVKKDMSKKLESLMKPMDAKCIKKTRHIETFQELKTKNETEFKRLLACGYIHNLFVLTALAAWEDFSKVHTEASLNSFIECILKYFENPEFIAGTLDYTHAKKDIVVCIK